MFSEEDKELYALIFTGPMLAIALFGGAGAYIWSQGQEATSFLVQHNILVSGDEALIPILDAGLDLARVVLIVAVLFLVLWATISMAARKKRSRA